MGAGWRGARLDCSRGGSVCVRPWPKVLRLCPRALLPSSLACPACAGLCAACGAWTPTHPCPPPPPPSPQATLGKKRMRRRPTRASGSARRRQAGLGLGPGQGPARARLWPRGCRPRRQRRWRGERPPSSAWRRGQQTALATCSGSAGSREGQGPLPRLVLCICMVHVVHCRTGNLMAVMRAGIMRAEGPLRTAACMRVGHRRGGCAAGALLGTYAQAHKRTYAQAVLA